MKNSILIIVIAFLSSALFTSCTSGSGQNPTATTENVFHIVKKCETASSVAKQHELSLQQLLALNPGLKVRKDVKKVRPCPADSTVAVEIDSTKQYAYVDLNVGDSLVVGSTTSVSMPANTNASVAPAVVNNNLSGMSCSELMSAAMACQWASFKNAVAAFFTGLAGFLIGGGCCLLALILAIIALVRTRRGRIENISLDAATNRLRVVGDRLARF